ncbi:MAG: TGS domain-containing protein, partial [Candidatus Dadabacteria bacterium]|nr:TGS domain-containing protein [Candidatus Dadabacteria bacterium]
MKEVHINLPDGAERTFPEGTTVGEIINTIGIQNGTIGARVNGTLVDFWHEIYSDSELEPVKTGSEAGLALIRHTAAHIMAEAVQSLFPEAKVTIGPVIENGFYYDFEYPRGFTPEDLEKIEEKMKEIAEQKKPLVRKKVSREKAID